VIDQRYNNKVFSEPVDEFENNLFLIEMSVQIGGERTDAIAIAESKVKKEGVCVGFTRAVELTAPITLSAEQAEQ